MIRTFLAKEFDGLVKTFECKKVISNHKLGTPIELYEEDNLTNALVLGYSKEILCIRMVIEKKAVDLIKKESIQ